MIFSSFSSGIGFARIATAVAFGSESKSSMRPGESEESSILSYSTPSASISSLRKEDRGDAPFGRAELCVSGRRQTALWYPLPAVWDWYWPTALRLGVRGSTPRQL